MKTEYLCVVNVCNNSKVNVDVYKLTKTLNKPLIRNSEMKTLPKQKKFQCSNDNKHIIFILAECLCLIFCLCGYALLFIKQYLLIPPSNIVFLDFVSFNTNLDCVIT